MSQSDAKRVVNEQHERIAPQEFMRRSTMERVAGTGSPLGQPCFGAEARSTCPTGSAPAKAEGVVVPSGSPPIAGKAVHAAFDGGRLTSDGGVLVLAEIDRRLGLSERLARCLEDPRSPGRVHHTTAEP
jgi:hypothetical protein